LQIALIGENVETRFVFWRSFLYLDATFQNRGGENVLNIQNITIYAFIKGCFMIFFFKFFLLELENGLTDSRLADLLFLAFLLLDWVVFYYAMSSVKLLRLFQRGAIFLNNADRPLSGTCKESAAKNP